jgi:hypothetical protein
MKNLRGRVGSLLAVMTLSGLSCASFVACSADDTMVGGTGNDGGSDGTTDGPVHDGTTPPPDGNTNDVSQDTTTPEDTTTPDTFVPPVDAPIEHTTVDASDASDGSHADAADAPDAFHPDSSDAADTSTAPDTSDAADTSTAPDTSDAADAADVLDAADSADTADARPEILDYPTVIQQAWCEHEAQCCSQYDGGTFDLAHCESLEIGAGGLMLTAIPGTSGAVSTGNVVFDPVAAQKCFDDIAAIKCDGSETAAHWMQTSIDCYAGMNGTLPQGSTCATSFECAPGMYCQLANSGDTSGTCQALQPVGGSCANESNYACTYQQAGTAPQLWCPGGNTVCAAPGALGTSCQRDRECQSGACDLAHCAATVTGPSAGLCSFLTVKDGG